MGEGTASPNESCEIQSRENPEYAPQMARFQADARKAGEIYVSYRSVGHKRANFKLVLTAAASETPRVARFTFAATVKKDAVASGEFSCEFVKDPRHPAFLFAEPTYDLDAVMRVLSQYPPSQGGPNAIVFTGADRGSSYVQTPEDSSEAQRVEAVVARVRREMHSLCMTSLEKGKALILEGLGTCPVTSAKLAMDAVALRCGYILSPAGLVDLSKCPACGAGIDGNSYWF
jgi:hypothetical protein